MSQADRNRRYRERLKQQRLPVSEDASPPSPPRLLETPRETTSREMPVSPVSRDAMINDMADRIVVIEALLLEAVQKLNRLLETRKTPETRLAETPDIPFNETPETSRKTPRPSPGASRPRPEGSESSKWQGWQPVGSTLTTSLKNLPQPPLNNPYGKTPDKPT